MAARAKETLREAIHSAAACTWVDDDLGLRDRSLVVIATLVTQGDAEQQSRSHTRWVIDHGCAREELEALAALLAIYAGYLRSSTGLAIIREELAELEAAA